MNRSPAIAGVLSVFFPGLGHLYAGANRRALALAVMFAASLHGAISGGGGPLVAAIPALWLFAIVNAVRVTEAMTRANREGRAAETGLDNRWSTALVVTGLLAALAVIPGGAWVLRLWPLLLVWVGVQLFRGKPVLPWIESRAPEPPRPPEPPGESAAPGEPPLESSVPAPGGRSERN